MYIIESISNRKMFFKKLSHGKKDIAFDKKDAGTFDDYETACRIANELEQATCIRWIVTIC